MCCATARSCMGSPKPCTPRSVHWFRSTSASTPIQEHDGVTLPIETAGVTRQLRTRILVNAEGGLFGDQNKTTRAAARATTGRRRWSARSPCPRRNRMWRGSASRRKGRSRCCRWAACAARTTRWSGAARPTKPRAARNSPTTNSCANSAPHSATAWAASRRSRGRASFPLGLNAVDTLVNGRVVAIGNAAQTLHPVAGQGLNLGLRDAHALADALSADGPTPLALAHFAQRRALDRRLTIGATDTLARLFTVDFAAARRRARPRAHRARIRAAGENRARAADDVRTAPLSRAARARAARPFQHRGMSRASVASSMNSATFIEDLMSYGATQVGCRLAVNAKIAVFPRISRMLRLSELNNRPRARPRHAHSRLPQSA